MPPLKLKLNTSTPTLATGASGSPGSIAQTPGSGLKLTFKTPGAPASATASGPEYFAPDSAPPAKQKRKYTRKPKDPNSASAPSKVKKRALEEGDDGTPAKRPKNHKNGLKIHPPTDSTPGTLSRTPSISLKLKPQRTQTQPKLLVIKAKGQKPDRPPGVGYDSEAEDAEDDPAIESQFILRMTPGDDCDTLRKAIEEKTVGEEFPVSFRFWDREGKRASVKIKDHVYAAVLVDLPCIIEGTKSWDKKGWYKSADISQMLLVLGRAKDDKEVQNHALPPEIQRVYEHEHGLYQYPHGLTPPMHYVRKRRFRKRVSYRTIEAVEEEVERLIQLDEEARAAGGDSSFESVDPEVVYAESEPDGDEDAEGEDDADADANMDADGLFDDDDEMQQFMMDQLDDDDEEPVTAVSANEAAIHALRGDANIAMPSTEGTPGESTLGETPGGTEDTEEDDDDDDDDDDGDGDDDVDEDAAAALQERAQLQEEIADLEKEVDIANQQHDQQKNPLLRKRAAQKLMSLKQDLAVKKAALGEEVE